MLASSWKRAGNFQKQRDARLACARRKHQTDIIRYSLVGVLCCDGGGGTAFWCAAGGQTDDRNECATKTHVIHMNARVYKPSVCPPHIETVRSQSHTEMKQTGSLSNHAASFLYVYVALLSRFAVYMHICICVLHNTRKQHTRHSAHTGTQAPPVKRSRLDALTQRKTRAAAFFFVYGCLSVCLANCVYCTLYSTDYSTRVRPLKCVMCVCHNQLLY